MDNTHKLFGHDNLLECYQFIFAYKIYQQELVVKPQCDIYYNVVENSDPQLFYFVRPLPPVSQVS